MQDLDDYNQCNPLMMRMSIAIGPSNGNSDEMCVPDTPKLTSVDSLCKRTVVETNRNEELEQDTGFLNRVVFDRDEILRKHYQIEKTDTELIKETLDHFSKRLGKEKKPVSQVNDKQMVSLKPRVRSVHKKCKSIDPLDRKADLKENREIGNDCSVREIAKPVTNKEGDVSITKSKKVIVDNTDNHKKHTLLSFRDIPAISSSGKRFPLEAREPDSHSGKLKERHVNKPVCLDQVEFSIDNQLLKKFDEVHAMQEPTFFVVDDRITQLKLNDRSNADETTNFFSVNISEENARERSLNRIRGEGGLEKLLEKGTKQSVSPITRGLSNEIKNKFKGIKLDNIKSREVKSRTVKTETNCYDYDQQDEDAVNLFEKSSCRSCDKEDVGACFCDKFKRMAAQLGVPYDENFVKRIYDSLFMKKTERTNDNNENISDNNPSIKLFNRKPLNKLQDTTQEKRNVLVDRENGGLLQERATHRPYNEQVKAKIDKLKAFKKYFMKTEKAETEERNTFKKQSTELNTFRIT